VIAANGGWRRIRHSPSAHNFDSGTHLKGNKKDEAQAAANIVAMRRTGPTDDEPLSLHQHLTQLHKPRSDRDHKARRTVALIDAGNNALSVQVLQEFHVQATGPTRPNPLPHDIATGLIHAWLRFKVQEISVPIITGSLEIRAAHRLSYWDAAIVAPLVRSGARNCIPKT
jgi:predicted nucleic acid-binding protein